MAPGYEMAEAVAKTLSGEEVLFTGADMSTKLKLMGVDVASFGRYAGYKVGIPAHPPVTSPLGRSVVAVLSCLAAVASAACIGSTSPRDLSSSSHDVDRCGAAATCVGLFQEGDDVMDMTWNDPFSRSYKKLFFNKAGTKLLGGILVGDASDFTTLLVSRSCSPAASDRNLPIKSPRGCDWLTRRGILSRVCTAPCDHGVGGDGARAGTE